MSSKNELAQAAEHARLRRVALASDILEGRIDTQDARERGRLLAGPLGEAWASFMVLSPEDQARALLQEEFRGVTYGGPVAIDRRDCSDGSGTAALLG